MKDLVIKVPVQFLARKLRGDRMMRLIPSSRSEIRGWYDGRKWPRLI